MNGENVTPAKARPSNAPSLAPEAALAMAGFVAGSLSRHVKPLPLACALAAGGLAWRCFARPRASPPAVPQQPEQAPSEPGMFASEEDFLRYFQAEAARLQNETHESPAAQPSLESVAEVAPVCEPAQLRTEEDFLRLFQAEMQGRITPPAVSQMGSPFSLVDEPSSMPGMDEGPVIASNALAPAAEVAPASTPDEVQATEAEPVKSLELEQVLVAELPLRAEEVMSHNAAWLLGLEPLPVIEFVEPAPAASRMPAEIPDRIEIPVIKRMDTTGAMGQGQQRPSSQGAMAQMLEREPGPSQDSDMGEASTEEPMPNLRPVAMTGTDMVTAPAEPEIRVPGWLQEQMQRDLPNSFPAEVIPKQEPAAPVIVPRRIVPRAPVTVPIDDEAKNWLNWWK